MINASNIANDPTSSVVWLEKAEGGGKVTLEDIKEALDEFINLFRAGLASKAEVLTLARAYPNSSEYTSAALNLDEGGEDPIVIGGPASVELVDREGHLITTQALSNAFQKFMKNDRTRNVMVLHSDVQVGWALPAYISKGGQIFKSGVNDNGLFFICELRDDTAISKKVAEQINSGQLKSYSIAGSATKVQNMTKGLTPYLQVDDMELAEVTVCEKGVNQGASFELLKAEVPQTGKVDKDQCGYRNATNPENELGINCGHCKYFNSEDKTCDVVVGDIMPGDYCRMFAPEEAQPTHTKKVIIMNSRKPTHVDFNKTFAAWMTKEDPLKSGKSFVTLENEAGRKAEHEQLLREYGFPSEQSFESMRYVPVVEVETDEDGKPVHNLPPWVVNEAGEMLGDRLDEDAPTSKAKVQSSGEKEKKAVQKAAIQKMGHLFLAEAPEGATYDLPYIIKHEMRDARGRKRPHNHDPRRSRGAPLLYPGDRAGESPFDPYRANPRSRRARTGRLQEAGFGQRNPRNRIRGRTPLGYTAGVSEEEAQQHIDDINNLNAEERSWALQELQQQGHPLVDKDHPMIDQLQERIANAADENEAQRIFDHMHQEFDRLPENRKRQNQETLAKIKQAVLDTHNAYGNIEDTFPGTNLLTGPGRSRTINPGGGLSQTNPRGQTAPERAIVGDGSGLDADYRPDIEGKLRIPEHKEKLKLEEEKRKERWRKFREERPNPLEGGRGARKTAARRMGDLFRGAKEGYGSFDPEKRKFRDRWNADGVRDYSEEREGSQVSGREGTRSGSEQLGRLAGQLGRSGVEAFGGEPISMLRRYLGRRRDRPATEKRDADKKFLDERLDPREQLKRIPPDALKQFREQQERARRTPKANAELDQQRELGIGDARSGEILNVHHSTFNTHGTHENLRNEHIAHHASGPATILSDTGVPPPPPKTLLNHLRHHDGVRNLDQDGVRFNNLSISHLQGKNLSDKMSHGEYMQWFNAGQANGNIRNNLTAHGQQHDMTSHFMHADAGYEAGKAPKSLTPNEGPMPTNFEVPNNPPRIAQPSTQGSGFFDNSLDKSTDAFIEIIKNAARSSYEYR